MIPEIEIPLRAKKKRVVTSPVTKEKKPASADKRAQVVVQPQWERDDSESDDEQDDKTGIVEAEQARTKAVLAAQDEVRSSDDEDGRAAEQTVRRALLQHRVMGTRLRVRSISSKRTDLRLIDRDNRRASADEEPEVEKVAASGSNE